MLYVTTRDKYDAYTTPRVLRSDRGPDGGFYLPFRLPVFTHEEFLQLREKSFGQCVADILNLFFCCHLTGWDVEFCIGRYPIKLEKMNHRILIAELWHNQDWNYTRMERTVSQHIGSKGLDAVPVSWVRIAVRIAVLVGLFSEMLRSGVVEEGKPLDIALPTGDFAAVMAVWYARHMELPIANIICVCNENCAVWDLLHHGEVRTDITAMKTITQEADIGLPQEIERLVSATLGAEEAKRYSEICSRGGLYSPQPGTLEVLRRGMFAAVVSTERLQAVIPSVYRTSGYIMGPYTALAYGGLLDYRTRTGESRPALLLADRSPVCDAQLVSATMNMSEQYLKEILNMT